jgi:nucleoside-diphosphate-sugar epimerase
VRLFVFGLGYTAGAFLATIGDRAEWTGGTVREAERAARLMGDGIAAVVFDGERPGEGVAEGLATATHLLVSIAPGASGDRVLAHHRADILAAPGLQWIGYLSTVGVYGDRAGAWVDEETPPNPRRGRSADRLAAEDAWSALAAEHAVPLGIFRLAGIYGPGRNAFVNLAEGRARRIVKPGQVFNRIHVADIAATLAAAAAKPASRIYNLADDEPAPPEDVVAFAAGLMGVLVPPAIPFDEADLSPMARSFYGENKRASSRRIRQELGVVLRYPTYRDGLTAMWHDGSWRQSAVE